MLISCAQYVDSTSLLCHAMLTTNVATFCHHTRLLWYHWLYSLCCAFYSHDLLIPFLETCVSYFPLPMLLIPLTFPHGNHQFFSVFTGLILLFVCLFICFFRFHKWVKSYDICLSQSDLFHLAQLGPSLLLQVAKKISSWPL